MRTNRNETITSNEYKIIDLRTRGSSLVQLLACGLNENIAFTLYSNDLKKAGMGVGLNAENIGHMLAEFTNGQADLKVGSIEVKLAGGNVEGEAGAIAEKNVEILMAALGQWDNNRDIINVTHQNTLDAKGHNAFVFSPNDNRVQPYDVTQSFLSMRTERSGGGCCAIS